MNVEIAMREKIVVDRSKHVVRRESDAMEIDTEVPTISNTSTITPAQVFPLYGFGGGLSTD